MGQRVEVPTENSVANNVNIVTRAHPTSLFYGSNGKTWPIFTTHQPDLFWLWDRRGYIHVELQLWA